MVVDSAGPEPGSDDHVAAADGCDDGVAVVVVVVVVVVVAPAWLRRWSAVVGIKTGTGMSLPFIPQSHTSDQSLIGIGIGDLDLGFGSMGRRSVENSCLGCCQLSFKLVLGPVDDAQNPRQSVCSWACCPTRWAWPEQPTTHAQPRPEKLWLHACFRDCPSISPLGLWFHAERANAAPTNRLRASFSLEFLGPRTCETESCVLPVACPLAQLLCCCLLSCCWLLLLRRASVVSQRCLCSLTWCGQPHPGPPGTPP